MLQAVQVTTKVSWEYGLQITFFVPALLFNSVCVGAVWESKGHFPMVQKELCSGVLELSFTTDFVQAHSSD